MKEFNLEEAINGKAFYLKNGYRGVIKYCVDDILTSEDKTPRFAYIGYVLDNRGFLNLSKAAWDENGITNEPRSYDAVGMVEDMLEQNTEEKIKMKPFDLKAALNGEPVMLRNGEKAFVKYNLLDELENIEERDAAYPLIGYRLYENNVSTTSWDLSGKSVHWETMKYDIVGMWEEPKISFEDLPKPFKPKDGDGYYYINENGVQFTMFYDENDDSDVGMAENAQCYRTQEDAQKWLDFMKSMME